MGVFFGKFGVLCFIATTVLRFALLHYYRRNIKYNQWENLAVKNVSDHLDALNIDDVENRNIR